MVDVDIFAVILKARRADIVVEVRCYCSILTILLFSFGFWSYVRDTNHSTASTALRLFVRQMIPSEPSSHIELRYTMISDRLLE